MDAKELHGLGERTLSKRASLVNLWQDMAMNFYPERADFTYQRALGTEFAANLMTSYPVICRRDLGNQITTMLRPTEKQWFHMSVVDETILDNDSRKWLEWATTVQRRAMYDRVTKFTQATKEGDHDFACFGQCVISIELNSKGTALLYRTWHLRDVAWVENSERDISAIFRKWKPAVRDLRALFPKTVASATANEAQQDPYGEVECMHIVVEAEMYSGDAQGKPYVSIYYDVKHDTVLEAIGVWDMIYVIPRWQTVSGSQYSYSPATVAALPDARLLQAMTYTLLEAGEKMTNPPWLLNQNVIRSDVALYAGGLTWADVMDDKLSEAMRPLMLDKSGMPLGIDMQKESKAMIMEAFYLHTLRPFNPTSDPNMTAFQAGQIVQDYIRKALPLFEPMEADYSGTICDRSFGILQRSGVFGPPTNMPRKLRRAEVQFRFKSPLHDQIEQMKGQILLQGKQLTAEMMGLDPAAGELIDAPKALRDALTGIGFPAAWTRSEAEVEAAQKEAGAAAAAKQKLDLMEQGANVAATMSKAKPGAPGPQAQPGAMS